MEARSLKLACCRLAAGLGLFCTLSTLGQQTATEPAVPTNFTLDVETAARLRPSLRAQSVAATGTYAPGQRVFEQLVRQVPKSAPTKFTWELRIVEDEQFNAFSSADGSIYVESGLAQLAGSSAGLWAAMLSHEIAHVLRRDWARRYLYQKSLEDSNAVIVLGDPGWPSASWTDPKKASESFAAFCRQMEIEADREGLMLMARAGYHPDFVPALHHLLHAKGSGSAPGSLYAMHPCWEERDRELSRAYFDAGRAFEQQWPEWYASPGGNPPTVIFAGMPTVRKTGANQWEIQVRMRCQNLVGAVEVVVSGEDSPHPERELRQLTGCTSPTTTIIFPMDRTLERSWSRSGALGTDVDIYILDAWGAVLARADLRKHP